MGWLLMILLALVVLAVLWRFARFDKASLQFLGAALLVACAGYAWQGSPGLVGQPKAPPSSEAMPDSAFADVRRDMLGEFDTAGRWLTIADSYHRRGDTLNAAGVIQSAIREHPNNADLWVGLGNALVLHADGMMTPAADLAFKRAETIAPGHPGPQFVYGLALAQGGQYDAAEAIWRKLLAAAPEDVSWRTMVEERLMLLEQARASGMVPAQ